MSNRSAVQEWGELASDCRAHWTFFHFRILKRNFSEVCLGLGFIWCLSCTGHNASCWLEWNNQNGKSRAGTWTSCWIEVKVMNKTQLVITRDRLWSRIKQRTSSGPEVVKGLASDLVMLHSFITTYIMRVVTFFQLLQTSSAERIECYFLHGNKFRSLAKWRSLGRCFSSILSSPENCCWTDTRVKDYSCKSAFPSLK